ncbi:hypothetical protein, partial [Clostridium sp.]|uniref:hypothetical protein n=1 Tax=Clostridium sp. TaxID=1506 RepID=UPI003455B3BB
MANKTIELRKDIRSILLEVHESVFYRRATDEAKYPYIVYSINDIYGAKVIEIDFWDRNMADSTRTIEGLVDKA